LRQAQVRKLQVGSFKPTGHFSEDHQAMLPAEWDFSDALDPDFWCFVAPSMQANASVTGLQDRLGTVIEIITKDHAFYGRVYVKGLKRNAQGQADGLYVECIGPQINPDTGKMCPVDLATGGPWKGRKPAADAKAA
jgi:hypothetical protein